MTATNEEQHSDALLAGATAAAGLKEALARVGVVVPSLRAGDPVAGSAFVELGGCNAGAVTKLAEVINAAADANPELRIDGR
ncbi:MAG TPA: hypothetical protein VNS49_04135 [Streptomyces sp.]|nr:hypothetical protein [Streptomyces sp.]